QPAPVCRGWASTASAMQPVTMCWLLRRLSLGPCSLGVGCRGGESGAVARWAAYPPATGLVTSAICWLPPTAGCPQVILILPGRGHPSRVVSFRLPSRLEGVRSMSAQNSNVLPKGVSEEDFGRAVEQFRALLGDANVLVQADQLVPYNKIMMS